MMIEDKSPATPSDLPKWVRKVVIPGLIGAVVGFAASFALLEGLESEQVGGLGTSATIAALVGMLYAMVGLGVILGVASPGLGARFLNVEDADELREQKKVLTLSGAAMTLWGVGLIAVALGAPEGPVPQGVALAVGGVTILVGTWLSIPVYRASDELMRAISLEGGAVSFGLMLLVAGGWAMLAHLGYAAGPAPIDLLSLMYALLLFASFIVVGRRGMLAPR